MNTRLTAAMAAGAGLLCAYSAYPTDELAELRDRIALLEEAVGGDLRVSSLVVTDRAGADRIMLRTNASSGEPSITLIDSDGYVRLALELDHGEAPYLSMRDHSSTRVRLEAPADGAAGLGVWGHGAVGTKSHAGLWVWDDQTIAFGAGLPSQAQGSFLLKTNPQGDTTFELRDAEGGVAFEASSQP